MTCEEQKASKDSTLDCGNVGTCIIYCNAFRCMESAIVNARNAGELRVIVQNNADSCIKTANMLLPNNGNAYFSTEGTPYRAFRELTLDDGTNTGDIEITIGSASTNASNAMKLMALDVANANSLYIKIEGAAEIQDGTITCPDYPPGTRYEGPLEAPCVIDIGTEGYFSGDTEIIVPNGFPKGVAFPSGYSGNSGSGALIDCNGRVDDLNGAQTYWNYLTDLSSGAACYWTSDPTNAPTRSPTKNPTQSPSLNPTAVPSKSPSNNPTKLPSSDPSKSPTNPPTLNQSTSSPSKSPTEHPTGNPTSSPSNVPTSPSATPTTSPLAVGQTYEPSSSPTSQPSKSPTTRSPTLHAGGDTKTAAPSKGPTKAEKEAEGTTSTTRSDTQSAANTDTESGGWNNTISAVIIIACMAMIICLCISLVFVIRRKKLSLATHHMTNLEGVVNNCKSKVIEDDNNIIGFMDLQRDQTGIDTNPTPIDSDEGNDNANNVFVSSEINQKATPMGNDTDTKIVYRNSNADVHNAENVFVSSEINQKQTPMGKVHNHSHVDINKDDLRIVYENVTAGNSKPEISKDRDEMCDNLTINNGAITTQGPMENDYGDV